MVEDKPKLAELEFQLLGGGRENYFFRSGLKPSLLRRHPYFAHFVQSKEIFMKVFDFMFIEMGIVVYCLQRCLSSPDVKKQVSHFLRGIQIRKMMGSQVRPGTIHH